jgi:multiple sugar transport system permease protein
LPLAWMVLTSFKTDAAVRSAPNELVFVPTLDTFRDIVGAGSASIATSVQIAVSVTLLVLLISIPAAYAVGRRMSRRWAIVASIVLATFLVLQMVPQPMAVIPLFGILAGWRLTGSLAGLVLVDTAMLVPFAVLLLRPFVLAVPRELYDAAEIDGASGVRVFRSIVVPLLRNGIATVAAIVFIIAWGEFIFATTLINDQAGLPVSGLLAQQSNLYSVSWNRLMALALLTSLPLVVVFLVARRRLMEGLSVGAVK